MSAIENILGMLPDRVGDGKNSQIYTPPHIAKEMVDALPAEVFNKDTTFLDICCKSGIFLYKIYQKLMESKSMVEVFPDETDRAKHIIHKQLFGIAPSTFCQMFSTRTVYGYLDPESNIISINEYELVMRNADKSFLYKTLQKEFNTVKFDIVIGNPPYNNDAYLDFVQLGHKLATQYTMMITPAKWMAKNGKKNDTFRKDIVPYIDKVVFYPNAQEIFNIAEIDGISYYIICSDVVKEKLIINKSSINGIFNNVQKREINGVLNNQASNIIKKLHGKRIDINAKNNHFKINGDGSGNIKIYSNGKISDLCDISNIGSNHKDIYKYKVVSNEMLGYAFFYDEGGKILGSPEYKILEPEVICSTHYCVYKTFDNIQEAQSFESYLKTKLIRFVTALTLTGTTTSKDEFWRFVPAPEAFDHIFTDAELYEKYNLTQEEINIIESVIKERK